MTAQEASQQWIDGAKRALEAARHMSDAGDCEFALFTLHLAVEKALKGFFVKQKDSQAPKIHNLEELAIEGGLDISEDEKLELRELTTFSEFGRYGDEKWLDADATKENVEAWLNRVDYFISLCDK